MRAFWEPALPRVELWRTALGFVLLLAAFFGATILIFQIGARLVGSEPNALLSGATPVSAAIFFATFLGFHLGLFIILPVLHKRPYRSMFGGTYRLNIRHFAWGFLVTLLLSAFLFGVMFFERIVLPEDLEPTLIQIRPTKEWIIWFLPAFVLIFLQIFAEEAVFRGYLLQQLRGRFSSVLVWAVLPSFIFGLLHFDPGTYGVLNASAYVINTTATGIMLALITVRTGNLGAAAGLHFGNNLALTVIGIEGNLEGFSLYAVSMELQSGYTAWSILSQTGLNIILFVIWWMWMNKRDKIAKSPHGA